MTTSVTTGDPAAVAAWLAGNGVEVRGRVAVARVGIGQSNITSTVTDESGQSWVLREPPVGASGGAHDMRREVMMLNALADTTIPVPRVVAQGTYPDGRAYYAMTKVDGVVLESEADASALSAADRASVGADVAEIIARLHQLSPDDVGLGHLRSSTPFVHRQLRRIIEMWERFGTDSPYDGRWRSIAAGLGDRVPQQAAQAVVHGDFRLSNLLVDNGSVTSVLDWELATVGDPLVDLAWLLDDWRGPADPAIAMPSPTRAGGFGSRDDLLETYSRTAGYDPTASGDLDYYRALTLWRAASLIQGVIARRKSGVMGDHGVIPINDLDDTVGALLADSHTHLDRSRR